MTKNTSYEKFLRAAERDPTIFCERGKENETFGHNPSYLNDVHGISKSDLIRLERQRLAIKAQYACPNGERRTRWIIFKKDDNG